MDSVKTVEQAAEVITRNLQLNGNGFYSAFKSELDELAFLINSHKQDLEIQNGNS